jgi:hypothetical protein
MVRDPKVTVTCACAALCLQLSESDIIEHLEKICDPSKPEGQWISHYDIVEKGTELKLVDTGKVRLGPLLFQLP